MINAAKPHYYIPSLAFIMFIRNFRLFQIVAAIVLLSASCNKNKNNNPEALANSEAGKILVIDATDHSETESPVLNAYMNTMWQVDSLLYTYEKPELSNPFDPLFIYDVVEPKSFIESMEATGDVVLNQQNSPFILVYTEEKGKKPSSEASEIIEKLHELTPFKTIVLSNPQQNDKTIFVYANVWCKNQLVVEFPCAGNTCAAEIAKFSKQLENEFIQLEYSQNCQSLMGESSFRDSLVKTVLNDRYNIDVPLAYNYVMAMEKSDIDGKILWFRNESPQSHSNILIQIKPYFDPRNWTLDSLVSERNRTTKRWLRNEEGGWVEVTRSGSFPIKILNKSADKVLVQGWYTELNTTRRGPFIREYILDKAHDRTIIVDGFLFAPNQSRTQMMRELSRYVLSAKTL